MNRKDDPRNPLNQIKRDFAELKQRVFQITMSIPGRWLANVLDPDAPFANLTINYQGDTVRVLDYYAWLRRNVIGPPRATAHYSRAELRAMQEVGLYEPLPKTLKRTVQQRLRRRTQ